jgi:hypothetical protein
MTDKTEYSIMAMFIEIEDSRIEKNNCCCEIADRGNGCLIYTAQRGDVHEKQRMVLVINSSRCH